MLPSDVNCIFPKLSRQKLHTGEISNKPTQAVKNSEIKLQSVVQPVLIKLDIKLLEFSKTVLVNIRIIKSTCFTNEAYKV